MQFFVPDLANPTKAANPAKAEWLYAAIKSHMVDNFGRILDRRIYSLTYSHDGRRYSVKVGDIHPLNGEPVFAIFRQEKQSGCYLICTPNRGVKRDGPILAGDNWETHSWDFE
jgi:hypothetical protein